MRSIKILWIYEGENGCWTSTEGRFSIIPGGWRGGVTPDFYEIRDRMDRNSTTRRSSTVTKAKACCLEKVTVDLQRMGLV